MLENARIITKLVLDRWEKLLLQNVLIPFFFHGSVSGQNSERESPDPWMKRNPTNGWSQDFSLLA